MTSSHLKELTIPEAESVEERVTQLHDEIDLCMVVKHQNVWAAGRDIDLDEWTINYPDGGLIKIVATDFVCLVGNREIQVDTLEAAEQWLWENHSSSNYLDTTYDPGSNEITCGACTTAIGVHTYDLNCKLLDPKFHDANLLPGDK